MRNLYVKGIIAAFALCIGVTGFSSDAHAEFTVQIDNWGYGEYGQGMPAWAASPNELIVTAFVGPDDVPVDKTDIVIDYLTGNYNITFYDHELPWCSGCNKYFKVNSVKIKIMGDDMFWIDQVNLLDENMVPQDHAGGDNDCGWCISTDRNDSSDYYCYPCNGTRVYAKQSKRLYF